MPPFYDWRYWPLYCTVADQVNIFGRIGISRTSSITASVTVYKQIYDIPLYTVRIYENYWTSILTLLFPEAIIRRFFKIIALRNFTIFTGKQLCWSLFLIKLQTLRFPTQMFSCDYWETFKNCFFIEHLRYRNIIVN